MKRSAIAVLLLTIILVSTALTGCKTMDTDIKKIKDLDFTVVEDADVPGELKEFIDEKKEVPFKMTYSNKDSLYIVVGYGAQRTGGYSVTVDGLYLTKNAIYINTNLFGPGKDEAVTQSLTYPYIVIKLERRDEKVVFE